MSSIHVIKIDNQLAQYDKNFTLPAPIIALSNINFYLYETLLITENRLCTTVNYFQIM